MSAAVVTLGSIRIKPLIDVEGAFFPLQVVFPDVAREDWEPYRSAYPETFASSELLYTRVTCYLIRHREHTILVDAGIGPGPEPLFGNASGRLLDQLAARGIDREQVGMVVLTHLHPDHVGWATLDDRPTFPRAKYLVSQIELETFQREDVRTAMHAIVPGYLDRCLVPPRAFQRPRTDRAGGGNRTRHSPRRRTGSHARHAPHRDRRGGASCLDRRRHLHPPGANRPTSVVLGVRYEPRPGHRYAAHDDRRSALARHQAPREPLSTERGNTR